MTDGDLARLLDEAGIRDVVARYAHHVDARSIAGILECFTDDAHFESADGSVGTYGRESIRQFFETAFTSPRLAPPAASTHLMANTVIDLDGDVAHAETQAVALLASRAEGLVTRGLLYSDDFVRSPAGWRIVRRVHTCTWEEAARAGTDVRFDAS
jgi:ketosteroid isomerase-like protein